MKRCRQIAIPITYLLIGIAISMMQTWMVINYKDRYSIGWHKYVSQRYWVTDPSTTGWMIGEPNDEGIHWDVLGNRNDDYRIYQIRHEIRSIGRTGFERNFTPGSIPTWTRVFPIPSIEEARKGVRILEQLNGWPCLAWRGEARIDGGGVVFKWSLPTHTLNLGRTAWNQLVLFPYKPVFPGVLYNALFFGGILFITVRIIKHTRRRITDAARLSRHQCTKCKYDITGLTTCPECGQPVVAKA